MKGLRRVIYVVVLGLLIAAVPVSALASEDLLRSDIRTSEGAFDRALTQAIAGGLDPVVGDQLLWRYSQIKTIRTPSDWWKAPAVHKLKLERMIVLHADLRAGYQQDVSDRRDSVLRALRHWNQAMAEAQSSGVSVEGLEDTFGSFRSYANVASSPNELGTIAKVLDGEFTVLQERMASFITARSETQAALQNAQTLLATARQYAQLSLDGFGAQIESAASEVKSVHLAAGFTPLQERLQQTAIGLQGLLDARAAAYAQVEAARTTVSSARAIGANLGDHPGAINYLAGLVSTAADQPTFQSLTSQLYQHKQALAEAISFKQVQAVAIPDLGVGKIIVVSISRQAFTAYQDGAVMLTAFVATGRPALPTPVGVYTIMAKYSPYQMISPWGYGSPYWYPPTWVTYAMLFRSGGYFIHDASWRSWFGPGANTGDGTHGCINVPFSPMQFLWNWAPVGTTVVVQY